MPCPAPRFEETELPAGREGQVLVNPLHHRSPPKHDGEALRISFSDGGLCIGKLPGVEQRLAFLPPPLQDGDPTLAEGDHESGDSSATVVQRRLHCNVADPSPTRMYGSLPTLTSKVTDGPKIHWEHHGGAPAMAVRHDNAEKEEKTSADGCLPRWPRISVTCSARQPLERGPASGEEHTPCSGCCRRRSTRLEAVKHAIAPVHQERCVDRSRPGPQE